MSGSSLDGLDLCYVRFMIYDLRFSYEILEADCIDYDEGLKDKLRNVSTGTAFNLAQLHNDLGRYFGQLTRKFMEDRGIETVDLIASHGQTIFHQPQLGFTTQIGCGAQIAAATQCPVVCDLRSTDVAYGGQGAPIVPVTERYLFPDHKLFLNIGGIANIAIHEAAGSVTAYDTCAANTLLNHFARQARKDYDAGGVLARSGTIIPELLDALNQIPYCRKAPPKSLGTEHILRDWLPLFDQYGVSVADKLATAVEHIAIQSSNFEIPRLPRHDGQGTSNLLVTGGGALNTFLIERLRAHCPVAVTVPDERTVKYKEALAMAFCGLLRCRQRPNVLASVTGATKDSIGGAVYLP